MHGTRRRKTRGVSLMLELLLGLTLVSLTIMALFSLFPVADRSVALADRTQQATSIARTLLEARLEKEYVDLSTDPATYEEGDLTLAHTRRHGQSPAASYHYRVAITQPDAGRDIKAIIVTVSWKMGARSQKIALEGQKGQLW